MTEIKDAKSLKDIDVCGQFSPDMSILMASGDANDPSTYQPKFINAQSAGRVDARRMWAPSLEDFNQFVPTLQRLGYKSVCKGGGEETGKNMFVVSKGTSVPAGIFGACDPNTTLARTSLQMDISPEIAKYIARRMPTPKDACTDVDGEGKIAFKFPTSPIAIKGLTDRITDDIKKKRFPVPEGVTEDTAKQIIERLNAIAELDPVTAQFKAMARQMDLMRTQLTVTVVLQVASILTMGALMTWQISRMTAMMGAKPKLTDFTTDLVEEQRKRLAESKEKNEIRGRDAEALEYLEGLDRPEYANPILVGESGAGKDEIVRRAAQMLALNDPRVPARLRGKKIIAVDPTALQAGTKFVGTTSERTALLKRAMESGEIIYMEELADFMSIGSHSGGTQESLGAQLKPVMTKKWSHWSGSTTPRNLAGLFAQNPDLRRRAPIIHVTPLDVTRIEQIFNEHIAPGYAEHYKVGIGREAVEAAVNLGLVYAHKQGELPRVDAVKQTLMAACVIAQKRDGANPQVTKADIARAVKEQFKIHDVDPDARWTEPVEGAPEDASPASSAGIPSVKELMEAMKSEEHLRLVFEGYGDEQLRERASALREKLLTMSPEERVQIFRFQGPAVARIPVAWIMNEIAEARRAAGAGAEGVEGERGERREETARPPRGSRRRASPEVPSAEAPGSGSGPGRGTPRP